MTRPCLSLLALCCASATLAQTTPPPASRGDVVVTGVRDQEREVRAFTQALTVAANDRQISRFETRAVCPGALGLPPTQRAAVIGRLRIVAKAAGVPLARAKCRPNVLVIVVKDKQALLQSLARDRGTHFGGLQAQEIDALVADTGPAVAWQLAGPLLNPDGREMPRTGDTDMVVNRTTLGGSRITQGSRPHLAVAVVVIQASALVGLTTTQLADYGAMRVFARTDPSKLDGSAAPTILKVLDAPMDSEVPVTLTRWDMGLLRGLYRSSVNLTADQQRAEVARRVGEGVAAPQ